MGVMKVLTQSGDERIEWDPSDKKSVEKAKEKFKSLKDEGYDFFEVSESKGKQVKRFSKSLGKVIAAPGAAKSQAQKTAGKALGGGPNTERGRVREILDPFGSGRNVLAFEMPKGKTPADLLAEADTLR